MLRRLIAEEKLDIEVRTITAASSAFNGAGYALTQSVLQSKPDILVLEWHSTFSDFFETLLWHSFLSHTIDQEIKVIIAVLPKRSLHESGHKRCNQIQAEQVLCKSIQIIDGYTFKKFDPGKHLRDEVHTTAIGAKLYAKNILKKIKKNLKTYVYQAEKQAHSIPWFYVPPSKRPTVDVWSVETKDFIEAAEIFIEYTLDKNTDTTFSPFLVANLRIGPDSPIVITQPMDNNSEDQRSISLWDIDCHYKRQVYKGINIYQSNLKITVSNALPDYANCKNKNFDFSKFAAAEKKICFKEFYLVGGRITNVRYA